MSAQARRVLTGAALLVATAMLAGYLGYVLHKPGETAASFEPGAATSTSVIFPGTETDHVGAGVFRVPDEAPPGTYAVTATDNTYGCAWKRRSALNSKPKSIIESDSFNKSGFGTFTVSSTDRYLELIGHCTWTLADTAKR